MFDFIRCTADAVDHLLRLWRRGGRLAVGILGQCVRVLVDRIVHGIVLHDVAMNAEFALLLLQIRYFILVDFSLYASKVFSSSGVRLSQRSGGRWACSWHHMSKFMPSIL